MPIRFTPAFIISVTCDKCGKVAPDVATVPIGVQIVRDRMEKDGWTFQESVLQPETPPSATCPECADAKAPIDTDTASNVVNLNAN